MSFPNYIHCEMTDKAVQVYLKSLLDKSTINKKHIVKYLYIDIYTAKKGQERIIPRLSLFILYRMRKHSLWRKALQLYTNVFIKDLVIFRQYTCCPHF